MYKNSYLHASFTAIDNKTVLSHRAFSAPLKITKTFHEPHHTALTLYMMDASPGMMDGDNYAIQLDVTQHSHAIVTNQASTKIHPALCVGSHYSQLIRVQTDAILEYFPEPTILYENCIYEAKTVIELENDATLFMCDMITCGRVERDEKYMFQSCSSTTEIKYNGKVIAYEHFLLKPHIHRFSQLGLLEQYTHQATVWFISSQIKSSFMEQLHVLITSIKDERVLIGFSQFEHHGVIIRLLGFSAWEIQAVIQKLWDNARINLLKLPPYVFRK